MAVELTGPLAAVFDAYVAASDPMDGRLTVRLVAATMDRGTGETRVRRLASETSEVVAFSRRCRVDARGP